MSPLHRSSEYARLTLSSILVEIRCTNPVSSVPNQSEMHCTAAILCLMNPLSVNNRPTQTYQVKNLPTGRAACCKLAAPRVVNCSRFHQPKLFKRSFKIIKTPNVDKISRPLLPPPACATAQRGGRRLPFFGLQRLRIAPAYHRLLHLQLQGKWLWQRG